MQHRTIHAQHPLSLLFLTLVLIAAAASQSKNPNEPNNSSENPQGGMSMDPLTPRERAAAERAVLAHSPAMEALGKGRRQLISVELWTIKPDAAKMSEAAAGHRVDLGRFAEVILLRYEPEEVGVRAIVDLTQNKVIDLSRIPGEQVPLTPADLEQAAKLALANPEVQKALGPAAGRYRPDLPGISRPADGEDYLIQPLPLRSGDEKDPCWKHRCMQLLFRRGDAYLVSPTVIVDLTTSQVRLERSSHETQHSH